MRKYVASPFIKKMDEDGKLWPVKGIGKVVGGMVKRGYKAAIDFGGDGVNDYEEINSKSARIAANELEMPIVAFIKDGKIVCRMSVIPSNGDDWLCDHNVNADLEEVINESNIY